MVLLDEKDWIDLCFAMKESLPIFARYSPADALYLKETWEQVKEHKEANERRNCLEGMEIRDILRWLETRGKNE